MKRLDWKVILLVLFVGYVLIYGLTTLAKNEISQDGARKEIISSKVKEIPIGTPKPQIDDPEIKAFIAIQDSEGVKQENMDMNFLKNLESWAVGRAKARAQQYFKSQGYPNLQIPLTSQSIYLDVEGVRLAVIRMMFPEAQHTLVVGIVGNEVRKVSCTWHSTELIPITYGKCADKIKEAFGVVIGKT